MDRLEARSAQGVAYVDGALAPIAEARISLLDWGFLPKVTVKYSDPGSAAIYGVFGSTTVAIIVFFLLRSRIGVRSVGNPSC